MRSRSREKIMVIDRGCAELAFPRDWSAALDPAGHIALVDPTDSCKLEISYLALPPFAECPPLADFLRRLLREVPEAGPAPEVVDQDRGDLWLAWSDYAYETDDTERRERRRAHCRHLLATNKLFCALLTFSYWEDDARWAVRAWERMVATLHLGDGKPLENPFQHWSLRPLNEGARFSTVSRPDPAREHKGAKARRKNVPKEKLGVAAEPFASSDLRVFAFPTPLRAFMVGRESQPC